MGFGMLKSILRASVQAHAATDKGFLGERKVRRILGETIERECYILNNLLLSIDTHKSFQIDHIYICPMGVFVIETKNYTGQIYGNPSQPFWTQILNDGKEKNTFYNPLIQNESHVRQLKRLLGDDIPMESFVVFANGDISNIDAPQVYNLNQLEAKIKLSRHGNLSAEDMETIYKKLQKAMNESNISARQHIQSIRVKKQSAKYGLCPQCGANLIARQGAYGSFLGCQNYPRCKFTKDIR